MVIQTATVTPRRLEVIRKSEEDVQRVGRIFKHYKTVVKQFADWEAMKEQNYPLEALAHFQSLVRDDGQMGYQVWNEDAEKVQNEFFAKHGITKTNLIKLEDDKCTYEKSIKVTWDAVKPLGDNVAQQKDGSVPQK